MTRFKHAGHRAVLGVVLPAASREVLRAAADCLAACERVMRRVDPVVRLADRLVTVPQAEVVADTLSVTVHPVDLPAVELDR